MARAGQVLPPKIRYTLLLIFITNNLTLPIAIDPSYRQYAKKNSKFKLETFEKKKFLLTVKILDVPNKN
jgi:hypothetical protein